MAELLPLKKFKRQKEDFRCEHCLTAVKGDGYTNHCVECLWSKHVDVAPGDRASDCGGFMEPIALRQEGDGYILTHRCIKCGHTKNNRGAANDNFESLLVLSRQLANK